MILLLVAAVAMLIPATASATHFFGYQRSADCNGWMTDFRVAFNSEIFEAQLDYTIVLKDSQGDVIETIEWSGMIGRDNPSNNVQMFNFGGDWSVVADPGFFVARGYFTLTAPTVDGGEEVDTFDWVYQFNCETVATEQVDWSSLKATFR
jgi:hypothetical protein